MKGKLFMLPALLAEGTQEEVISPLVKESIRGIQYFVCENVRTARRFVASLKVHDSIESLHFEVLDKDTREADVPKLLAPLERGEPVGVLSESGCPGVADPGALAVAWAHQHNITVVPLAGPSSIILALMASGLNGQHFAFHGYLPVDSTELAGRIKLLERESRERHQTQIFIETPYRNNALMSQLMKSLRGDTRLCMAIHLTSPDERIICQPVADWKKNPPTVGKEPAVFLFLASA